MAELGNITIACDLTTQNNIAMLEQLTETWIVLDTIRSKNETIPRMVEQTKYDKLEDDLMQSMRIIMQFAVTWGGINE